MDRGSKTPLQKRLDKLVADASMVEPMIALDKDSKMLVNNNKKRTKKELKILYEKSKAKTLEYLLNNNFYGLSCLNNAVKRGNFYLAELLLQVTKVNPNSSAVGLGKTALHYSTECHDNEEFFKNLVTKYQADVNSVDVNGTSVLHLAVYNNRPEQVNFLLANGCTAGTGTFFGFPIHVAAFYGHTGMVQSILQTYPLEVNRVHQGYTPTECSLFAESSECFILLSPNCHPDMSVLYKVISGKRSEDEAAPLIKLLLGRGINANAFDDNLHEELPILAAARRGWVSTVGILLEHTDPIEGFVAWDVPMVLTYAQSQEQMSRTQRRLERVTNDIIRDLNNRQILSASCLLKSVQYYMEPAEWEKYECYCKLRIVMGMYTSVFSETDPESISTFGRIYINAGLMESVQLVAKSLELLYPNSSQCRNFAELLKKKLDSDTSMASMASTSSRS